jgi:hypothetical protein
MLQQLQHGVLPLGCPLHPMHSLQLQAAPHPDVACTAQVGEGAPKKACCRGMGVQLFGGMSCAPVSPPAAASRLWLESWAWPAPPPLFAAGCWPARQIACQISAGARLSKASCASRTDTGASHPSVRTYVPRHPSPQNKRKKCSSACAARHLHRLVPTGTRLPPPPATRTFLIFPSSRNLRCWPNESPAAADGRAVDSPPPNRLGVVVPG